MSEQMRRRCSLHSALTPQVGTALSYLRTWDGVCSSYSLTAEDNSVVVVMRVPDQPWTPGRNELICSSTSEASVFAVPMRSVVGLSHRGGTPRALCQRRHDQASNSCFSPTLQSSIVHGPTRMHRCECLQARTHSGSNIISRKIQPDYRSQEARPTEEGISATLHITRMPTPCPRPPT